MGISEVNENVLSPQDVRKILDSDNMEIVKLCKKANVTPQKTDDGKTYFSLDDVRALKTAKDSSGHTSVMSKNASQLVVDSLLKTLGRMETNITESISKVFSPSDNSYTDAPNIHVAPQDLGFPGILPVLNKKSISQQDPDLSYWSKVEGLSDVDIVKIFHFETNNSIIVAYENGNIDFIIENKIINLCDIKDKSLSSSKTLNICREFDDKAYLVYPFGIVIIDLRELVISDTWFTKRDNKQFVPTDISHNSKKWYITTTEGIFSNDTYRLRSPIH